MREHEVVKETEKRRGRIKSTERGFRLNGERESTINKKRVRARARDREGEMEGKERGRERRRREVERSGEARGRAPEAHWPGAVYGMDCSVFLWHVYAC